MNRTEIIIAVDPGKMTGVAVLDDENIYSGYEDTLHNVLFTIHRSLDNNRRMILVCEDFIFTTATVKKTRQTWSTEGIGVLRYLAAMYGVSFIVQGPAATKKFSIDEKLKAMGWYVPTTGGHRNDAARHLLLYADSVGRIDRRRLFDAID